ncbi:tyrosine--tRNA ligase MSY1 Ecym_7069 [Eremothecium cymbalariae DBVPG|uniref:Tyrosine--tRNA ligase n=1 Tax=Eremothecium cymbalariae (strain CBS 270.75 / DBVPG 7215 / KCTC 17166 / NRRL Y-17582) TaxID=931890 RepID=G8JVQ7_ERECY|nr:hypothetical protein Ecym_7069 [Eremothecium cymbalariae DBVPG\
MLAQVLKVRRLLNFGCRWNSSLFVQESLLDALKERGLLQHISEPKQILDRQIRNGDRIKLYCGVDPTAQSLHLGNLIPFMILLHFYVRGHDVVPLVGGATGMVGDPSGRSTERKEMALSARRENVAKISGQLSTFFENGWKYYQSRVPKELQNERGSVINTDNYEWWKDVNMLEFLSKYGRHIRVQSMLSRDSVSSRLKSQDGLGFNEFTYQILQAFDFYHLYKTKGVSVQVGGTDQWGNITAGIDLIKRLEGNQDKQPAFGMTVPLLTTSTGEKFGKSAGNALFIDSKINSSFQIYQFFVNTNDEDITKFLKMFTMLSMPSIVSIIKEHQLQPQLRLAQRRLATEVVDLIHGIGCGHDAEIASDILFGNINRSFSAAELIRIFQNARILQQSSLGIPLSELVMKLLDSSKAEAKRKLAQGSIYLGISKTKVIDDLIDLNPYLIDEKVLIIRIGKRRCHIVEFK